VGQRLAFVGCEAVKQSEGQPEEPACHDYPSDQDGSFADLKSSTNLNFVESITVL